MLKNQTGQWVQERSNIGSLFVDHCMHLFSSSFEEDHGLIEDLIHPVITPEDNDVLCAIPSSAEIKDAVFQLGVLKAPGPDGYSVIFFQHYWGTVGVAVTKTVKHFFRTSFLLKQINHSFIALVPKVEHPIRVEQFRPISLCNVVNKVISKILAGRLRGVIAKPISHFQAAFVLGRVIQDNAIIGQEVLHSMKAKRERKGLVAFKLDMEKAYDRMEWNFLLSVLRRFGFGDRWV
ncbi:hypothetical protein CJ030_MR5G010505 [Morella rubra]|uniref:Reverse transcriptase domain-containing protein n=1 Tax=Morella rubra TaxID=262757 RepID=A0A6A1VLD9_9ROSI|nr:hypothetical protein CJ030_MR5G010505 [Morella rubra]